MHSQIEFITFLRELSRNVESHQARQSVTVIGLIRVGSDLEILKCMTTPLRLVHIKVEI